MMENNTAAAGLDEGAPVLDWTRWPNFSRREMACRHTGECAMRPAFMDRLQALRDAHGRPLIVTSGYRAPTHPIEAAKPRPGVHSLDGAAALELVRLALALGFTGIGVSQRAGRARFLHLDDWDAAPRPNLWSY